MQYSLLVCLALYGCDVLSPLLETPQHYKFDVEIEDRSYRDRSYKHWELGKPEGSPPYIVTGNFTHYRGGGTILALLLSEGQFNRFRNGRPHRYLYRGKGKRGEFEVKVTRPSSYYFVLENGSYLLNTQVKGEVEIRKETTSTQGVTSD